MLHWLRNGSHLLAKVSTKSFTNFLPLPSCLPPQKTIQQTFSLREYLLATQLKACKLWTHGPDWLPDTTNWLRWTLTNVLEIQVSDTVESCTPSKETTLDENL